MPNHLVKPRHRRKRAVRRLFYHGGLTNHEVDWLLDELGAERVLAAFHRWAQSAAID